MCKSSCNFCDYSTNPKRNFDSHNKTKAHLAKEANANGSANGETEAAVVFKYSCSLCDFSTNFKKKFGRHKATQAHRAREAEARLNTAIVDKYRCSLCDYSADREEILDSVTSRVPIIWPAFSFTFNLCHSS
ncbi:hypothetical protein CI102_1638 [Trichoderma harzianum]|nr:hypothetical protein CI102_1638 [Trichoderma harzianum]